MDQAEKEIQTADDAFNALQKFSDQEQILTNHLYFQIQGKPGTLIASKKVKFPIKYFKGSGYKLFKK